MEIIKTQQGASVCHYLPKYHSLEMYSSMDQETWNKISNNLPEESFLLAINSIHWREACWRFIWKGMSKEMSRSKGFNCKR